MTRKKFHTTIGETLSFITCIINIIEMSRNQSVNDFKHIEFVFQHVSFICLLQCFQRKGLYLNTECLYIVPAWWTDSAVSLSLTLFNKTSYIIHRTSAFCTCQLVHDIYVIRVSKYVTVNHSSHSQMMPLIETLWKIIRSKSKQFVFTKDLFF